MVGGGEEGGEIGVFCILNEDKIDSLSQSSMVEPRSNCD